MESQGAQLKRIRQERGLSLEEVQKKTKIHLNILKSIEGDSLTDINPVYLKGFLKIYCKFLGLDPKDYILDYKEVHQVQTVKVIEPDKKSARINLSVSKINFKKVKIVFIFIFTIFLVSFGLFNLGRFISARKEKSQKVKVVAATSKPKPTQVKPQKEVASVIRLGIRARENCWVNLKVDGKVVFQRVLEKGRFEAWQAKEKIELSLGNAQAVELELNGQLFSNLGRKGQPLKNIVITKNGLTIPR